MKNLSFLSFVVSFVLLSKPVLGGGCSYAKPVPKEFETMAEGYFTDMTPNDEDQPFTQVIRSSEELQQVWNDHLNDSSWPDMPEVDFDDHMLVIIVQEPEKTTAVRISSVKEDTRKSKIYITYATDEDTDNGSEEDNNGYFQLIKMEASTGGVYINGFYDSDGMLSELSEYESKMYGDVEPRTGINGYLYVGIGACILVIVAAVYFSVSEKPKSEVISDVKDVEKINIDDGTTASLAGTEGSVSEDASDIETPKN
uniref:Uncharacterized protein n=1 Tax=Corethron hystrix TaxID=216773 RepID=A0A7S1BL32_9STRA|mmetsp:Transcript_30473/g.69777  ORF Transcript_30473/g.69777 Transcript_30473/m.69777 type:complete len:255 (+) Transcript_30473:153-917(+)|eukprot:CAMPEP_0113309848 /NCGR_PEP_ID=MMETSP0010_2-20120614/7726_1 /TAXON_ID=216773 ORGANISM="Corethron hystrix, Strain 308" /NCGR_SAMPLE_ID=MMETSP0010_2 /ASSEMBLY_ACC=CAM_ASM_000155 /LENGTH=254 /DNA_ID=CAMNT_0000165179 /DNA_START=57 /DNA_END=821 /DNA_ORIENTATION=+ /assembly_acc=CAM_ASM_000155